MIAPIFSEEHELFRRSLRAFLAREVTPHYRAWEAAHKPDRDFWRKAGAEGFIGMALPEQYGGHGGDFLFHVVAAQELGACPGAETAGVLLQEDLPAFHMLNFGSEEQKAHWLPRVVTGETVLTVAMTEPNTGSDVAAIRTQAVRDGDDYVINGSKLYISGGLVADLAVVAVKTDPAAGAKGVSLFLIELNSAGIRRGSPLKKMGMNAGDNAELFFENVRVPASALLGREGGGFGVLMSELPRERLLIAVRSLEEAQRAFDLTVKFTQERVAFGSKIIDFQNSQFALATMKTELTIGRAFVDQCIREAAAGSLDNLRSAMAKLWITEMQGRITDRCVQLHGGAGYMDEYDVSKLYTAARVTRIYGGSSEIMRLSVARTL
jgi:acyl-CoA dehydrogenase